MNKITADMIRQAEQAVDGAIVRLPDGSYEARPLHRRWNETPEEFAALDVVAGVGRGNIWDGLDVDDLPEDERYEALAENLTIVANEAVTD